MKPNLYLKQWRTKRGLSVARLAELSGRAGGHISEVENGVQGKNFTQDWLEDIARALDITPYDLQYTDPRAPKTVDGIPVLGAVSAGADAYYMWDYDPQVIPHGDRLAVSIPGAEMALPIRGDSMYPRFRDGEMAVVGRQVVDPVKFLGRDVAAQISGDQRVVIKVLERSPSGRWSLASINPVYPRIEDVDLDWVRPVIWTKMN